MSVHFHASDAPPVISKTEIHEGNQTLQSLISAFFIFAVIAVSCAMPTSAQNSQEKSIGGREHEDNILGVKIGMDIPTALETIFVNSGRKPGQEKPDAKRTEGKDGKDVRVLYKGLKAGEVQIVFANGQRVKEVVLVYAAKPLIDDLRLPYSSNIGEAFGGARFDDRYTIGYTSDRKLERFWWRDDKTAIGYRIRVGFVSIKITDPNAKTVITIARKILSVTPGDEEKFMQAASTK